MSIRNALANTRAANRIIEDTIRNAALEQTNAAITRHLTQTAERAASAGQQTLLLLEAAQEAEATSSGNRTEERDAQTLAQLERRTAAIRGEKASKKR